jgi:hypothetical protein
MNLKSLKISFRMLGGMSQDASGESGGSSIVADVTALLSADSLSEEM